jgi:HD-like signal output (HDOD) protein
MGPSFTEVTRAAKLISLPDVYLCLRSVLDDPDFAMAEVAVVISKDPAISVRLLRIVNSSLYGFSKKIETVSHALSLLGTQQVHDIVLTTSVAKAFAGMSNEIMNMQRFWQRSVYCAVASRQLAALCSGCDKERLFLAGLLHDIGHLVMYQAIPELSQQAIITAGRNNQPIYRVERELIGFDYGGIGGDLMRQWSLPESLWETTMFHVEPEKAVKYPLETALVHLGALLTMAGEEAVFNEGALTAEPTAWEVSGLTPEDCLSLSEQVEEEAKEVMSLILPRETVA